MRKSGGHSPILQQNIQRDWITQKTSVHGVKGSQSTITRMVNTTSQVDGNAQDVRDRDISMSLTNLTHWKPQETIPLLRMIPVLSVAIQLIKLLLEEHQSQQWIGIAPDVLRWGNIERKPDGRQEVTLIYVVFYLFGCLLGHLLMMIPAFKRITFRTRWRIAEWMDNYFPGWMR